MASRTSKSATDALAAYRRAMISDDIESSIADLSRAIEQYTAHRVERAEQEQQLATRQGADEDAVLKAFDAAKAAGAKPATLAAIGLRPDSILAAARSRAIKSDGRTPSKRTDGAARTEPVADGVSTASEPTSSGDSIGAPA